jgi:UDP-N-acetylmuramate dehydrogenase
MKNNLINEIPKVNGIYKINAPLSHYTWLKVGGCADILYKPYDIEDLSIFLKNLQKEIPITILGAGSNVIIRDGGIEGVVIKLGRNFNHIEIIDDNLLKVGASMLNMNLSSFCLDNHMGGLEFLSGIPGTIGGGIAMNAGSYGREFKDIIYQIEVLDRNGNKFNIDNKEINFSYRKNDLPKDLIFISAIVKYHKDLPHNIKSKIEEISNKRRNTQPITEKTGGSTFANPQDNSAWKLIDNVGLRGYSIGGAKFSEQHCNFMINTGSAKASDLEDLGELAIERVFENFKINLEWEIKRLGKR